MQLISFHSRNDSADLQLLAGFPEVLPFTFATRLLSQGICRPETLRFLFNLPGCSGCLLSAGVRKKQRTLEEKVESYANGKTVWQEGSGLKPRNVGGLWKLEKLRKPIFL